MASECGSEPDAKGAKGNKGGRGVQSEETVTSLIALGGYKPLPGMLRLVIDVDPEENIKGHALVPFPETYEVSINMPFSSFL